MGKRKEDEAAAFLAGLLAEIETLRAENSRLRAEVEMQRDIIRCLEDAVSWAEYYLSARQRGAGDILAAS